MAAIGDRNTEADVNVALHFGDSRPKGSVPRNPRRNAKSLANHDITAADVADPVNVSSVT